MSRDVPDSFIPDETRVLDARTCPGCGEAFTAAAMEQEAFSHDGATWHFECILADSDAYGRAETGRRHAACGCVSHWQDVDGGIKQMCVTCQQPFTPDAMPAQGDGGER